MIYEGLKSNELCRFHVFVIFTQLADETHENQAIMHLLKKTLSFLLNII